MQTSKFSLNIRALFKPDYHRWDGVPKINIYCLRFLYTLMFVFLGKDSWSYIFANTAIWDPQDAMVWSVWGSFSMLAFFGILHPLKMLPILLLEICYKIVWLVLVAYPLWMSDQLIGSRAEGMTTVFLLVLLPILFVPWKYVFKNYILLRKSDQVELQ